MIVFRLLRINAGKKTDGEKSEKVVSIRPSAGLTTAEQAQLARRSSSACDCCHRTCLAGLGQAASGQLQLLDGLG